MHVLNLCPLVSVFIDCIEEEVVNAPYMPRDARVRPALGPGLVKENLPFLTRSHSDLHPQTLNPCIVDAPLSFFMLEHSE